MRFGIITFKFLSAKLFPSICLKNYTFEAHPYCVSFHVSRCNTKILLGVMILSKTYINPAIIDLAFFRLEPLKIQDFSSRLILPG